MQIEIAEDETMISSLVFVSGENESERSELVTISFVEFVLKLNPVETQRVKEGA